MPWKIENHLFKIEVLAVVVLGERESEGNVSFTRIKQTFSKLFLFWWYFSNWKT